MHREDWAQSIVGERVISGISEDIEMVLLAHGTRTLQKESNVSSLLTRLAGHRYLVLIEKKLFPAKIKLNGEF
jgi:hypothetical protein